MERYIEGIKYEPILFGNDVIGWRLVCNYSNNNCWILIPDNIDGKPITTIGESAFSLHSKIEKVELPDSVEIINTNAFRGCRNLRTVVVYNSSLRSSREVLSIYAGAFEGCHKLKAFLCDKPCHLNGKSVFCDCFKLEQIGTENQIFGNVYRDCFRNCVKLEKLHIISRMSKLWTNGFYGCTNLNTIRFDSSHIQAPKTILEFLSKKHILCNSECNLTELAYCGTNVEIIN